RPSSPRRSWAWRMPLSRKRWKRCAKPIVRKSSPMTSRYRTDLDKAAIDRAVVVLRAGGIVCIPTESSYGLAVDPSNPDALDRLAILKGRPEHSPFALIACD